MAVPFAQTTRSLSADRGMAMLTLLGLLSLLLLVWLVWAFTSRFSVYAVSETTPIRLDDTIAATFPGGTAEQLRIGQKALVYLDAPPLSETVIVPAHVIDVVDSSSGVLVELAPDFRQIESGPVSSEVLAAFSMPVSGHVEIEVERLSPALLILRSAGLHTDTARLDSTN